MRNTASFIEKDFEEAREQVIALTGIAEDALNEMKFNAAMDCLEKVLGSDEHGIYELPKNVSFWLWWKEQWYRRDVQFINALQLDTTLLKYTCAMPAGKTRIVMHHETDVRDMYYRYHRMDANNPLVNSTGMEVSFHYLMKELANQKHVTI